MNFFTIVQMGSFAFSWFARASMDGKLTHREIIELVDGLIAMSGLKLEIDVPDQMKPTGNLSAALSAAVAPPGMPGA